jgi:hypothetical protein
MIAHSSNLGVREQSVSEMMVLMKRTREGEEGQEQRDLHRILLTKLTAQHLVLLSQ